MTHDQALSELKEGNRRFRENQMTHPRQDPATRKERAILAEPFAVILTCADSRVAPEIIFDQGIGDLFTVRVAGNVALGDEIASVEYAIEQFHTPLCVVMGHTGCRAVEAALSGKRFPFDLDQLLKQIRVVSEQVRRERPKLVGAELAAAVMRRNVFESVEEIGRRSRVTRNVQILGAEYQVDSGKVVWLDASHSAPLFLVG